MASIVSPSLANCFWRQCLVASTKPFASVLALAFGWNLLICEPAQSQEQPDSGDDVLELLEVTVFGAARNGRALLETPSAVTVIEGAEMERLQPSTYEELMRDTPGVVIPGGRGVAQEPNIRGFHDEQVVVRVDGARQNFGREHRGRFFVDPVMLKQVEILRGGASSMFGSGALGGVISLETKDARDILQPGQSWGSEVNVGFDSQGSEALRAVATAFQQENVDMLAFFSQRLMQADLVDGDDNPILDSAVDNLNGMLKLGWSVNDDHELSLAWRTYTDDGQVPNTANRDTSVDVALRDNRLVDRDLNYQQYSVKWNYIPFGNDLVNLSALVYHNETIVDESRVSQLAGESQRRFDTTSLATVGAEVTNLSSLQFGTMPATLSYGLEFFKDEQKATRNDGPLSQSPTAQRSFYAGFVQADLTLRPEITFSSGLRYDAFSLDPPDNFSQRNESALSPWIAFNWNPSDSLQFFTSVSQSFKSPTLTEMYAEGTHFRTENAGQRPRIDRTTGHPVLDAMGRPVLDSFDIDNQFIPNPDLKSEKATQIEIGTRYQRSGVATAGDQLLLAANAYYSSVDNYIETFFPVIGFTPPRGPGNATLNMGTATRNVHALLYGFEAEMSYDTEHWFTSANLTIPRGSSEGSSHQLANMPQDRFSLTLGFKPDSRWQVGLRSTVAGERDVSAEDRQSNNFVDTPGFLTFDVFANLQLGDPDSANALLLFGIDNLTNQKYRLHPNLLNSPGRSVKLGAKLTF